MSKLVSLIAEEIRDKYPNYAYLSPNHKKEVVSTTIRRAVSQALPRVKIPLPPTPFKRKIEELRQRRRSEHYKKTHRPVNYQLWELLYRLKKDENSSLTTHQLSYTTENSSTLVRSRSDMQGNVGSPILQQNENSNNLLGSERFFKIDPEDDIFNSLPKIRERLQTFNSKLKESVAEIRYEGKNIDDSLFRLYELRQFLSFMENLEYYSSFYKNRPKMKKYVDESYSILRTYYFQWLKKHGIEPKNKDQVEIMLLKFERFRKLNKTNPLVEGFVKLFSHSMNMKKDIRLLDKKSILQVFGEQRIQEETHAHQRELKNVQLIESEVLRLLFKNNQVRETDLKRIFLASPLSMKIILSNLEKDGLITIQRDNTENIVLLKHQNS